MSSKLIIKIDPITDIIGVSVLNSSDSIIFTTAVMNDHINAVSSNVLRNKIKSIQNRHRPKRDNRRVLLSFLMANVRDIITLIKRLCRYDNIQEVFIESIKLNMLSLFNSDIKNIKHYKASIYNYSVKGYLINNYAMTLEPVNAS